MEEKNFEYSVHDNSIKLYDGKDKFAINYPGSFLKDFGKSNSERIAENLLYLLTAPIGLNKNRLNYKKRPFFEKLINNGILKDIPAIAELVKEDTHSLISTFKKIDVGFENNYPSKLLIEKEKNPESVVISMSFGKDSLLSFALAKELGLDINLVFFNDMEEIDANEYRNKVKLIKDFTRKLKNGVDIVYDNTDKIFANKTKLIQELVRSNVILSYTLEILPISYKYGSEYIIFGSEHHFNDHFVNKDGFQAYSSYDQSGEYMAKLNKKLDDFSSGLQTLSLVEPIYNLAEYKVLKNRYPEILRHIMSCSGDEKGRWCYSCPTCAKAYLYSIAVGINPEKIGFKRNFFDKKFESFYQLFSKPVRIYEMIPFIRDEQLLAFYLAYKNGYKGYLIEKFRKNLLEEAKEREDELYKKFFKIYNAPSIPNRIKKELNSIYKEELK